MSEKIGRSLVIARSGGRCERCGGIGRTVHHRLKRSQGGDWSPSNLLLLCGDGVRGCHGLVESRPNDAEAEGFHVRPWQDPEEIPVKYHRTEWLILLPDGGVVESDGPDPGERVCEEEAPVCED